MRSSPASIYMTLYCSKIGCRRTHVLRGQLDVLIFRLRSYHVLIMYSAECDGPKFYKTLMFLGHCTQKRPEKKDFIAP